MPTYVARVALYNFSLTDLPDGLKIESLVILPKPESHLLRVRVNGIISNVTPVYPLTPDFLEIEYQSSLSERWLLAEQWCKKVITLLRLFKDGSIFGHLREVGNKDNPAERLLDEGAFGVPGLLMAPPPRIVTGRPDYTLCASEVSPLAEHLQDLLTVDQSPFRIAIDRFNSSYERTDEVDRLIDLMVAFEALFSEDPQAVGYKIALRCVMLLNDKPSQKEQDLRFLKGIYNRRSKIIHGKSTEATKRECEKAENLLRRSIVKLLHLAKEGRVLSPENIDAFLFFEKRNF